MAQLASKAGCPEGFRASNPSTFNLLAKMKTAEPFKALLSEPRPSRPTPSTVLVDRSNILTGGGNPPPSRPPFQPPQPKAVQVAPPPPPQAGKPSHRPHPHPSLDTNNNNTSHQETSKWNPKLPRGQQDANVGQARQWNRQAHDIYSADGDDETTALPHHRHHRPPQQQHRNNNINSRKEEEEEDGNPPDDSSSKYHGAFQTASAKYVTDLRKEGKQGGGGGGAALGAATARANTPGLRRGTGAPIGPSGGNNGGPGGKFVPPFVKKALQAQQGGTNTNKNNNKNNKTSDNAEEEDGLLTARTLELLRLEAGEPLPEELSRLDPALIEQVCNEVIDSGGEVTWEDIAGQDAAKKLIQEVVVWPMLNPQIFRGARAPPKGILLFGPPGTGKTLLGKAIASNIKASFFSISASSLTSKWIGEGEKMVRVLFAVAGWLAPAVIFIDEIDSLLSARKSEGEHEASRRLKTEMLIQMEGCDPVSSDRRVLLIGATNRPEELDEAARRRMPKQLYIPLPCGLARKQMVQRQLGPDGVVAASLSDSDLDKIVDKTAGYSGSDMKNLIQEACQGPVRDAVRAAGAGVAALSEADLRAVMLRDFAVAARAQRASVEPGEIVRYEKYNDTHGAKVVSKGVGEDGIDEDDW